MKTNSTAGLALAFWLLLWALAAQPFASFASPAAVQGDPLAPPWTPVVEPWPEADRLFHQEPRWLGGDGASSVDLGGGRVLWLFGDSFVAPVKGGTRSQAAIVRNSVAIQRGYDPSRASITFHWREHQAHSAAFFGETEKDTWYWPGGGILLDDTLLIFLMKIRAADGPLGFETLGWDAVAIDNPGDAPDQWSLRTISATQDRPAVSPKRGGLLVGSASVLREGDYLYAIGAEEPGHAMYATRWPLAQARVGDLSQPAAWPLPGRPLFAGGATELTVHHDRRLRRFVAIQTEGFGAADLALRTCTDLAGPWTPLRKFYRPPESADTRLMIYAGKCHPELTGADWVLTYVANAFNFQHLLDTPDIYYPRFLKVHLPAGSTQE